MEKLFPHNRRFVCLWSVLIVLLSTIPLGYGYYHSTPEQPFLGYTYNAHDTNAYLSWMEQSRRGHWLLKDPYTLESHQRVFFHPLFISLGKIAAISKMSNIAIYQACRVVSGFFVLLTCYFFVCYFFEADKTRLLSFLILSVSSGLSWMCWFAPTLAYQGACLFSSTFRPAGNTFWSMYVHPLFSLSIVLLLLCLLSFQKFMKSEKYRYAIFSGVALLLLVQFHPFDILIPIGVLFLQILLMTVKTRRINRTWLFGFAIMCSVASPYVLYAKFILLKDPVFGQMTQTSVFSPTPIEYFCMYGFLMVLSMCAVPELIKDFSLRNAFLLSWLFFVPIMVNLPIEPPNIPTRLIEGYHILLSILTARVISKLILRIGERRFLRNFVISGVVLFLSLGNVWVLFRDVKVLRERYVEYYLPVAIKHGMDWLKKNSHPDDAVLASHTMGNLIPAIAGNRVFLGHWFQTIDWARKNQAVKEYFNGNTSEAKRNRLHESWGIRYVFHSPLERQLGAFDPGTSSYLAPVFQNGIVGIYRFRNTAEGTKEGGQIQEVVSVN